MEQTSTTPSEATSCSCTAQTNQTVSTETLEYWEDVIASFNNNPTAAIAFIDSLIAEGANINAQDSTGTTLLMKLLFRSRNWSHLIPRVINPAIIRHLVSKATNINLADNEGRTALHYAVGHDKLELMRVILDAGANPNAQDKLGRTIVHIAAQADIRILQFIVQYRRERIQQTKQMLALTTATHHRAGIASPARTLSTFPLTRIQYFLNQPTIDLNIRTTQGGYTPLHYAAMQNGIEQFRLLLQAGANRTIRNEQGHLPEHDGSGNVRPEFLEFQPK